MAWTSPATSTAGATLAASWLNTYVRDNTNYLKDSPSLAAPTITTGLTFSGNAPSTPTAKTIYADSMVKAWVRVTNSGTPAISADFNVSSLTDNGVGDTTVTFATALATATYAAVVTPTADSDYLTPQTVSPGTGSVVVRTYRVSSGLDIGFCLVVVGG